MSNDTTIPESKQPSIEELVRAILNGDVGDQIRAHAEIVRMAVFTAKAHVDLRRENEALRAQVAAHEDADRRWSADMTELRRELQEERDFRAQMIAENDAMMGVPG